MVIVQNYVTLLKGITVSPIIILIYFDHFLWVKIMTNI